MNKQLKEKLKQAKRILNNTHQSIFPTFTYSILSNYLPGQIYIDSSERSALIGTYSGIFVVAGDERNEEFHNLLLNLYSHRKKESKRFTLFTPSEPWNRVVDSLFKEELRELQRYSFQFNKRKYIAANAMQQREISKPFRVAKINAMSITQSLEFNESYILEYWGSISRFLEHGVGYYVLHNDPDTIVSECISIFASPHFAEIDIATHPDYRGMGLAQSAAELFIEHCMEHHIMPKWDCDITNTASIKLAAKLGFDNPRQYSIFARK